MKNTADCRYMLTRAGFCLLICTLFSFGAPVRGAEMQVLHGHVPRAAKQLTPQGRLAETNRLRLAIALPLRNPEGLTNLLRDIYDPTNPNYRHFITPEQFTERFGPTEQDFQAVLAYAKANGLKVTEAHPNRLIVDVEAAVPEVEKALHVRMQTYAHPTEDRTFYAPDVEPSLELAVSIAHISGLDNHALPQPRFKFMTATSPADVAHNSGSGVSGTYAGRDFRAAYVPDSTLTGFGQTVGLLQFDGYTPSDITAYETKYGLPNVTLTNVLLDGYGGQPTGGGGEVEVSLDIEMAISMAPGLSKVVLYEAGPSGNWHDILNRMATDNLCKQISCSWYIPGGSADPVADGIFQQMAAQGQSFFAANGDFDAYSGLIPFPGDTPYITEVGGTFLNTTGPGGARTSETVWNRGDGIGTGGGISTQYAIPAYQTNISMTANHGSTTMRNVPDVALTADNVDVIADGSEFGVGGTSCSSPLWAGFIALVNQQAAASGRPPVGLINSAVDAIGTKSIYALTFNDITVGNNFSSSSPNNFPAATDFDLCTGWGTPTGQNLINALANPEPLLIQPVAGFAALGGVGGPFTVSSETLTLTNTGSNALNWVLANPAPWLSATPASGTLTPGGPATVVTVSLNAAASNLTLGSYTSTISFTNVNDTNVQVFQYSLTIIAPPSIITQPTNLALLDGMSGAFAVVAGGGLPLSYQWQLNGTNLVDGNNVSGSLTNVLSIAVVSATNAGTYTVIITNAAGTVTSSNAVLTITPSVPVITSQPAGQTVYATTTVQFSVAAVGNKPFFYQWTLGGATIDGATNSSLTLNSVQTNQSGNYAVIVSNSIDATLSSNAVLVVNPLPPCFPLSAGLVSWWQGEGNTLDSAGTNNGTILGTVTYAQGEVGRAFNFNGNGDGVIVGNPTNLQLQDFTIDAWIQRGSTNQASLTKNGGIFFAYGSGGYGFGMNDNGALFLSQIDDSEQTSSVQITDLNWHHVALAKSGTNLVFYVDGAGYPATYDRTFTFGSVAAIGVLPDRAADSFLGLIDEVDVFNRVLQPSDVLLLYEVGPGGKCPLPLSITAQPTNQTDTAGHTVTFSVGASGSQPINYQWFFNTTNISSATNATLVLTNVQLSQAGNYSVLASNAVNAVLSSNATLTVNPAPPCAATPSGLVSWWQGENNAQDAAGTNNGVAVGTVTYGRGEVGLAFTFGGSGEGITVGNAANLQLQNFTIDAWVQRGNTNTASTSAGGGMIFAYGSGGYGFAVKDNGALLLSQIDANEIDSSVRITDTNWHHVAVTMTNATVVFYVDGVAYPAGTYARTFTFGTQAAIGFLSDRNANTFIGLVDEVDVFNRALAAGEVQNIYSAGAGGKCPAPLTIVSQPVSQSVYAGNTVDFSVTASGAQPISYQWFYDSNSIAGATNASFTLDNIQIAQSGNYSVVASDFGGAVSSSNAVLTVNPIPSCYPPPAGLVSWWQAEGTTFDAAGTNSGTLTGSVTYAPGEVGRSFSLNGKGDGIIVGNPANLQLQNFTIDAWVQRGSTTNASFSVGGGLIFSYGHGGYGFGMNDNGQLFLSQIDGNELGSTVMITDTNWHHAAVTKVGSAVVFYLDGLATAPSSYGNTFTFTTPAAIGLLADRTANSFLGQLDEVDVFSRALSPGEIQVLYLVGAGGKCLQPPAIVLQPVGQSVYAGSTAIFSASATGSQPLTYRWTFNGTNLPGATNLTLMLTNVQATNSGTYVFHARNSAGTAISSNAVLTVSPLTLCSPAPVGLVAWWPGNGNTLEAVGGNNGSVIGGVTYGAGEVGQAFSLNGSNMGITVGNSNSLRLQDFTIDAWIQRKSTNVASFTTGGGLFFSYGSGGYGFGINDNGQLLLSQIDASQILSPVSITDLNRHHVAVTKSVSSVLFYVDGVAYNPGQSYSPGFTFTTLAGIGFLPDRVANTFNGLIDEVDVFNRPLASNEVCAIFNAGTNGKCAVLPVITTQPVSQLAMLGCSANFNVVAAANSALTYQWWKDGLPLAGKTNSSLSINTIASTNFGTYFVVINTTLGGSLASSNAVLALDHAPVTGADTIQRFASGGVRVSVATLVANDTDADGDPLTITGVSSNSFGNGTVTLQGGYVYYTPAAGNTTNSDVYSYTVSDGHCGGTATGFVTVQIQPDGTPSGTHSIQPLAGGAMALTFDGGFPGRSYRIQYSDSLTAPIWHDLSTQIADSFGTYQFTDHPPANSAVRYYRAISP